MAKIALLCSSVFGNEAYESLLSFMRTEKNDTLDEVMTDFMGIACAPSRPLLRLGTKSNRCFVF